MMKMARTGLVAVVCAVVCAVAGCGPKTGADGTLTIRDGDREWKFVAVKGESRINLAQMTVTEEPSEGEPDVLSMPRFWIAEAPVTEGDFAKMMGREVRDGWSADQAVAEIEWEEALAYCDKFTERYKEQLPAHVFASMPSMLEWAHAVKVLDYPDWLDADAGTFLFTRNQNGGFLCAPGRNLGFGYDLARFLITVPKRATREYAGLRLVLVDIADGVTMLNGAPLDNAMVSRGAVLTESGLLRQAKALLERVLSEGKPSAEERERAEQALAFASEEHEFGFDDWYGLVTLAARGAEAKGFEPFPFVEQWRKLAPGVAMEDADVARAYEEKGIVGEWVAIGDLPEEVREEQSVGETHDIMMLKDDDIVTHEFEITPELVVQVLRCDFTGDGTEDMVVESFGSVGADGYWYDFFEGRPDGSHVLLESLQTVGLCAIPRAGGGACGFITLSKVENPVLSADLLTFRDGEAVYESVLERPIAMIDVFPNMIYACAPFIGPGMGLGWKMLEGKGFWYRPLFWPWAEGEVQGWPGEAEAEE